MYTSVNIWTCLNIQTLYTAYMASMAYNILQEPHACKCYRQRITSVWSLCAKLCALARAGKHVHLTLSHLWRPQFLVETFQASEDDHLHESSQVFCKQLGQISSEIPGNSSFMDRANSLQEQINVRRCKKGRLGPVCAGCAFRRVWNERENWLIQEDSLCWLIRYH